MIGNERRGQRSDYKPGSLLSSLQILVGRIYFDNVLKNSKSSEVQSVIFLPRVKI
jgi:hypothetical protein